MNNERTLYISPEDDLPSICTRLEHAHSRRVTLVLPIDAEHLHAFVTWRMLHAYTRRRGIRVHIVSTNPYFRSVARSARFQVTKSLNSSQHNKSTRFSARTPSPTHLEESMNVGDGINSVFLSNDDGTAQHLPPVPPTYVAPTLMFTDDDVLSPPHPGEPPVRISKPPQPLNMPRIRRTRPLMPPRLPWDDVDDDLLPPQPLHKPIRRRTNPLVQSVMRKRGTMRSLQRSRPARNANIVSLAPILFIGIFIVVRSIVQYVRKRAL